MSAVSSLIEELKRRNVFKVVAAYAVTGFIVLQLCDILFPALGIADEVIGTVLMVLLVGLPIVVIVSWMYEITPDGLKRSHEVANDDSISGFTGQRMNQIIIGLLSVAVLFFAYAYFSSPDEIVQPIATETDLSATVETVETTATPTAPVDTRPSIAVLPFVNMSSDIENEHFSDGLSEEMLNLLAQVTGLRVAGRTSSFFYKGKNINLTEIGEALNVDHILEGSVRKSGDTVRITAQLISAGDGFHLWSKTFDRKLDDIFAVQDEIAGEVTRAMQVTLLTDGVMVADRTTTNTEAYDLYLRGKDALYTRTRESLLRALKLFEQAIALDPEYAPPLVDYAVAQMVIYSNHSIGGFNEKHQIAFESLEKAANLDYLTSDYYAALGLYHQNSVHLDSAHFAKAEASFQKAIELNSNNVRAYMWWSSLLNDSPEPGRFERAEELNRKAIELDPLNRVANGNYAGSLQVLGRMDEAEAHLKRLIRLDPEYPTYRAQLAFHYGSSSRYDLAVQQLKAVPPSNRAFVNIGVGALLALNEPQLLDELLSGVPADNPSMTYAEIGRISLFGEPEEIRAEAEVLLLNPDPEFYAGPLINGLLEIGQPGMAKALIENARPEFKQPFEQTSFTSNDPHLAYMKATYLAGDVVRARQHAARGLEIFAQVPSEVRYMLGGAFPAVCHIILGEQEQAVVALTKASEQGWRGYYREFIHRDPIWSDLRELPEIQAIKDIVDRDLDQQRPNAIATLREAGLISSL